MAIVMVISLTSMDGAGAGAMVGCATGAGAVVGAGAGAGAVVAAGAGAGAVVAAGAGGGAGSSSLLLHATSNAAARIVVAANMPTFINFLRENILSPVLPIHFRFHLILI
jgi:hypothetical protein